VKPWLSNLPLGIDLIPFRSLVRGFSLSNLKGDALASINVSLLTFPQGIAFALIAGIPPQFGVIGAAIAAIVGSFFAKSSFITLGPTNATSVLLLSAFASLGITNQEKTMVLPIIVMMTGIFLVVGSLAKVASLTRYISRSVITGYITAASVLIVTNQLQHVFGLRFVDDADASTVVHMLFLTLSSFSSFDWHSVLFGVVTLLIYLPLSKWLRSWPVEAITLFLVGIVSFLSSKWISDVARLDPILLSEWGFALPSWNLQDARILVGTSMAIAILGLLEAMSIGKSLAARSGDKLDSNQEMFNMGMANLACSVGGGMPVSGSLARSVLNWRSGAKTPLASLISGILILVAALSLGPFITYIPKAALAVVVISIGLSLINKHQIFIVTHATGSDKIVFYITLLGGLLLPLDLAIYLGTGISIFLFLKKAAAPELIEYAFTDEGKLTAWKEDTKKVLEISIVHVEGDLFFGSAELFRDQIRRVCEDDQLQILILRMKNAYILDATCVMALEELINYMHEKQRHLLISGVREKIFSVLERSRILDRVGRANVFKEHPDNPTFSTALAMRRAQELLGGREATITIYVNPQARAENEG
jgi:sulfate permease, SulP family